MGSKQLSVKPSDQIFHWMNRSPGDYDALPRDGIARGATHSRRGRRAAGAGRARVMYGKHRGTHPSTPRSHRDPRAARGGLDAPFSLAWHREHVRSGVPAFDRTERRSSARGAIFDPRRIHPRARVCADARVLDGRWIRGESRIPAGGHAVSAGRRGAVQPLPHPPAAALSRGCWACRPQGRELPRRPVVRSGRRGDGAPVCHGHARHAPDTAQPGALPHLRREGVVGDGQDAARTHAP